MPKYEIMLIVDPTTDLKETQKFVEEIFGSDVKKFSKMDRTELAYPINKTNTAQYVLMDVETDTVNIKEFTRKVNIEKSIWRELAVNLDTEKAMETTKFIRTEADVEKMREEMAAKRKARFSQRDRR